MKTHLHIFILIALFCTTPLFASHTKAVALSHEAASEGEHTKPFVVFNEGVTYALITRIIKQDDYKRSNFVWQNHLLGLYFEAQTVNMRPFNSLFRVAVYYPFQHTFNGMNQVAKQLLLYAFDAYAGVFWQKDMWHYVRINFSVGPHFLYELSDEYHHVQFGGAVLTGVELPIAQHWTIINNGMFALDYPNLGSNRAIAPYNLSWEYQVELGMRYSRRLQNKYAYIKGKHKNESTSHE